MKSNNVLWFQLWNNLSILKVKTFGVTIIAQNDSFLFQAPNKSILFSSFKSSLWGLSNFELIYMISVEGGFIWLKWPNKWENTFSKCSHLAMFMSCGWKIIDMTLIFKMKLGLTKALASTFKFRAIHFFFNLFTFKFVMLCSHNS